jgi:hypothetical protein
MSDDFDLKQLAEIGDPFADDARAPIRPMDRSATRLPRSPTRSRLRMLRAIALVVALAYDAAWVVFHERRADLASASPWSLVLGIAIPLAAAALGLVAALRPGPRGLGHPASKLAALAVGGPIVFLLGTLIAAPAGGEDPLFWRHAAICMAVTALLALGPMALGLWVFRHAFAAVARWRTAALGVTAGGLAAATMSLACPNTAATHVILGHGLVMVAAALIGALLGPALARS